jgi:AcrR family transcriptional regulator
VSLTPPPAPGDPGADDGEVVVRARDADATRRSLLTAGRRRFARDGYSSTKVRDIAADAGANVALINRYFSSKEGLFEACLVTAQEELDRTGDSTGTFTALMESMTRQVAGPPNGERSLMLLLLLRSSGDAGADRIRRNTLRHFAERMSIAAGWDAEGARRDDVMLRAEIALATVLGIALLRSSTTGLEPLAAADADVLRGPLTDVMASLLAPLG